MRNEIVAKIDGLSKCFKVYDSPWKRAKEWLTMGMSLEHKDFWALRNISFELKRGESLGIIGPNGAGKSTLLKILTGVLYPTSGNCVVNGKILSLLELGTGFNPELTGRQNIFHSSRLLGFPKIYLRERLSDIEQFSELGEFFDRPYKSYSSGMRARLGFSLFAFLECDIFVIDEVLSVGDVFFRQKCYTRIEELLKKDISVILVTHSMSTVQQYCQKSMVLNKGENIFLGNSTEAVKHYFLLGQNQKQSKIRLSKSPQDYSRKNRKKTQTTPENHSSDNFYWPNSNAFIDISNLQLISDGGAKCTGVALCDTSGGLCRIFEQGTTAYFYYEFELLEDIGAPIGSVAIRNDRNILVHGKTTLQLDMKVPSFVRKGQRVRFRQTIELNLIPGDYTVSIGFATLAPDDYDNAQYMSYHELEERRHRVASLSQITTFSVTMRKNKGLALTHHGLSDLPGSGSMQLISHNVAFNNTFILDETD
ncbi:MAG: ABC transporter ATP-binding protein [Anaerolineae bacterium]|nr:ABC transporter ATP-binding protein [Anaerolineae bacterium]